MTSSLTLYPSCIIEKSFESRTIRVELKPQTSLSPIVSKALIVQKTSEICLHLSAYLTSPVTFVLGIIPFFTGLAFGVKYLDAKEMASYYERYVKDPSAIRYKGIFDQSYYKNKLTKYLNDAAFSWKVFKISAIITVSIVALFILGFILEAVAYHLENYLNLQLKQIAKTRTDVINLLEIDPKALVFVDPFFLYDDEIVAKALELDFSNIELLPKDVAKQLLMAMCLEDVSYDQKIPEYLKADQKFMEEISEIRHTIQEA
jgi:hypothetical protein